MRVAISYPPLDSSKGAPLLSQNRQFQYFKAPTYIYPVIPAQAATLLNQNRFEVIWDDAIAEQKTYQQWRADIKRIKPDIIAIETKTPVVKQHWRIIDDIKKASGSDWSPKVVLMGDHVTAMPEESFNNSPVDYVITGGDYGFSLLSICKGAMEPGIYYRESGQVKNTGQFRLNHNLDELPFIDRDLTKWKLYAYNNGNYKCVPGTYTMAGRDCLSGDVEILLKINGELQMSRIGDITDSLMSKLIPEFQGISEVIKIDSKLDNIYAYGFDPRTLKVKLFKVKEFIRKPSPKKMYEILTESGRRIKVTSTHPFFVLQNAKLAERSAKDLLVGDYCTVPLRLDYENSYNKGEMLNLVKILDKKDHNGNINGKYKICGEEIANILYSRGMTFWMDFFGIKPYKRNRWDCNLGNWRRDGKIPLNKINKLLKIHSHLDWGKIFIKSNGSKKPIPVVVSLDENFGRVIGYLLSDGNITASKAYCNFGLDELDLVKDFRRAIKQVFGVNSFVSVGKDKKGKDSWFNVCIPNSTLAHILKDALCLSIGSEEKIMPPILFQLSDECILNFLSSYLAGDGFGGKNAFCIRSTSKSITNGLCYLFMRVGIPFQIRRCKKQKPAHNIPYEITITNNYIRYIAEKGFLGSKRQKQMAKVKWNSQGPFYSRMYPIKQLDILSIKNKLPYRVRRKIDYGKQRIGRKVFDELLKYYPNKNIERLIGSNLRFDKIVKITSYMSKDKYVYDLHIPGVENFVGGFGGLITHNCWYHKCTFCSWVTTFPKFRARKPENLLDEIGQLIERYQVKEIMDDTGTFPVGPWLREFCQGVIERGYNKKINIDCNMRFNAVTLDDYKLMKKANFRLLLFGLESARQDTLNRIDKNLTVEQIVESCKLARTAGLFPHITIMFGFPWETYEDARETLKLGRWLLKKGYAYTVQATMVIPYPGTPLFEECKERGWLKTMDWDRYDMKEPVMKTPMPDARIMKFVQGIYSVVFNPEFFLRRITSIRDIDDMRYYGRGAVKVLGHLFDFKGK